jgi:HSP20 family protein
MARSRHQDDDLTMDDELTAAFLEDDQLEMPIEQNSTQSTTAAPAPASDDWDEDNASAPGQLAVDVFETKDTLVVKARTAGVNKADLDVSTADGMLTIRGTLSSGDESDVDQYHIQECYWGEFSRSIPLPVAIMEGKDEKGEEYTKAQLEDGVLTISFTKVKQDSVKKITVL